MPAFKIFVCVFFKQKVILHLICNRKLCHIMCYTEESVLLDIEFCGNNLQIVCWVPPLEERANQECLLVPLHYIGETQKCYETWEYSCNTFWYHSQQQTPLLLRVTMKKLLGYTLGFGCIAMACWSDIWGLVFFRCCMYGAYFQNLYFFELNSQVLLFCMKQKKYIQTIGLCKKQYFVEDHSALTGDLITL